MDAYMGTYMDIYKDTYMARFGGFGSLALVE